jgi:DNA polymerase-4
VSEPLGSQEELKRISSELLRPCFQPPRAVRLLGVTLSNLETPEEHSQAQFALLLEPEEAIGSQPRPEPERES